MSFFVIVKRLMLFTMWGYGRDCPFFGTDDEYNTIISSGN